MPSRLPVIDEGLASYDASMTSARYLGPVSLGMCMIGMVTTEVLINVGICANSWWRVLAMGFEAGTIGGMADWFAVSALFRTVPIPVLSRHTNIIAKNRTKIVDKLKDYVQNKLLTPAVIREKLTGVRFSSLGLQHLDVGDHRQQLHRVVRSTFSALLADVEREDIVLMITLVASESLRSLDVSKPVGGWLRQAIEHGDHSRLWEGIIGESQRFIRNENFKQHITEIIKVAAAKERGEGVIKKLFLSTAEATGGFRYDSWAEQIAAGLCEWLEALKQDPQHGFRREADHYLLDYASAMETGRPDAVAAIAAFKQGLLDKIDLQPLIRAALGSLKSDLRHHLADEQSALSTTVASLVDGLVGKFRSDPKMQSFVDEHVGQMIGTLIETNHTLIGDMVASSLSPQKISDRELVAQIEDRIGNDLQYIRLNGAIVGSVVGALIMAIKFMILGF